MSDTTLLTQAARWLETYIFPSETLAAFGFACAIGAAVALTLVALRILRRLARSASVSSNSAVRRAGRAPGYRIMIADFGGRQAGRAREAITAALEDYLAAFSFGVRFQLFRTGPVSGRPEGETLRMVRRRLRKSDGDMVIWGTRENPSFNGLVLCGVTRGGSLTPEEARGFSFAMPGDAALFGEEQAKVTAYLLAKQLQPALSRPEAFRPEKIEELGRILDELLSGEAVLPAPVRWELERDFSSIVLHLSEVEPRADWLEKVIALRTATLEALKEDPDFDAQVEARLDLGAALLKIAEARFDPASVREASVHLNAVVDALRPHDVIRKVQRASDGLARAQALVETRRRFAVNFSG